ncbi:MAG: hypothetical protein A2V93_09255 [Ignavibacteria bacterium RBG_16_34_14]|nr:MAG: hypothetical protein A2V93_09255 [Ignavibacteria bacterium RBG_16_34_14]
MFKKKLYNYIFPFLLGTLMFTSNFMNTELFNFGDNNFAVWFVLSVLCFAVGWYINKSIGWKTGGKIVFSLIIAATFVSILIITFFREYFSANELLTENIILYSLRNITLGAMALFGMAVAEVIMLERSLLVFQEKQRIYEETLLEAKKEAELTVKEAKIEAKRIINDAEITAKDITLKKNRIESELKDFIQAEKELIKKYEGV